MAKFSFLSRRVLWGATVGAALLFFVAGIIFWGGFNTIMDATNEMEFCISCHEMEENVYQEYQPTIHHSNRTGVRAVCSDCHVPKAWGHKMIRKIQASNEVLHKILGTIDTPEKFQDHRLSMAKREWKRMKSTDSRECRNCHNLESMNPKFQKPRARKQHLNAFKVGQTCIDCHKGIAHNDIRNALTDEELEELEAPNPDFIREVPEMFLAGLAEVEAEEKAQAEQARAEKEKQKQQKTDAKAAEKQRIEDAVAAALAAQATANTASESSTTVEATPVSAGFGVDWSDVPARQITIFYPGQTSMEWVLNGRDHGGSRAFVKSGDSCVSCHDKETASMGEKMVSGEKAETMPIPGKRGSIPVDVQAAHDGSNVYFRFAWEDGEHADVPFVDGGKMDPDNAMKIALMLTSDQPEFAAQAGCWGTCHHDMNYMPDAPEADAIASSSVGGSIDTSMGITKYIQESRTKIEVKGRRKKPRGGWDQLKTEDEIAKALEGQVVMDLLRYKAGTGEIEDGYVLEDRKMSGGQGFEVFQSHEGSSWVIVLKRPMTVTAAGDIALQAGTLYNFGFAIHDDYANSRFHHVSLGYKLGFDDDSAEINAVKRDVVAPVATAAVAATSTSAEVAPATSKSSVNWDQSGSKDMTLFYPGQASMEWILNGRDHGGSRAFLKSGDSCASCHDKETAAMGEKIVSGEIAEETPIPGKRGSIPLEVKASYDDENLYLRLSWEKGEHNDVPFAEGGKLDPDNEMKVALMLATDELEFAGQAGCWATCHHDNRTMPHTPDAETAAATDASSRLDISAGISKYVKESRTKIEIKGRGGKMRGGWDKLKSVEEIEAAKAGTAIMDLMRYKSGDGATENGHIFDERVMSGGQDFNVIAKDEGDSWVVELSRPLTSDKPGDISLSKEQTYNFGIAIHDDYSNARFHHVSLGYKLGFDNDSVDLNALHQ